MKDLGATNDDLYNVLLGVDRPIIIVGLDLRIRRFTQSAERVLSLLPADIGRPVTHLGSFLGTQPPGQNFSSGPQCLSSSPSRSTSN